MFEQRRELTRESEGVALMKVIKRLLSETVARAKEPVTRAIVNDERPHAIESLNKCIAPLAVAVQQHFGIGMMCDKLAPALRQFRAQFEVIVNLAIEDDANLAVARPHGLRAATEIDDRESAKPEKNTRVFFAPMSFRIRSAMSDRIGHAAQHGLVAAPHETRYPAHRLCSIHIPR